ncbi:unnamed protein product [Cuscuta campestris]|uniref:Uncharacterized protein n=1 Tax=Cuscuta campestris TaxID=132261 RepID=A0A484NGY4_9ASTE|nr:unnamed protein product [Cuscuta campestris]
MRTRFPCTDYSISNAFQATDFLRLPLPHLPPIISSGFKGLPRFDQLSILGIDIGINQLPIEKALSKLLSECLPNFIDVDFDVLHSDKPARSREVDSRELTSSNSNQNEQEGIVPVDVKQDAKFDILQFEIPELDSVLLPVEDTPILPDISFVEKKEIPSTETTLQYPLDIPQSLYAVDEIHLPTFEEKKMEEEIPEEAMIVRSFYELIVREELTMTDSFFKSLPVPVCLDHERSRSLHSYVEEILVGLDSKQLFASDGLYLDWHILEEVNSCCNEDSLFSKLLGDAYTIDTALESGDSEMLLYKFIFSGDSPKASKKDASEETLHISFNDTLENHLPFGENSSSTLQVDSNKGASTDGESSNSVSKKKSSLAVPFSPFNDLNLLLNQEAFSSGKEHKLTDQLSDFHTVDDNNAESQKKDQHYLSSLSESDKLEKQWRSIIVVNTQDFDKQMIISRIKTYQNILSLEKKGAQVIERDLHHPVDVIISASICIAWYTCSNIAKKATASDEAFSCLPLCLENIATSILTSLSYAFDGFILVFEGERSFLDGIIELSDQLYAAAPSLGIDMQIFCSYSPEMTEKIIISCIEAESTKNRGMLPKMPESETLAESFLTMFPSINPLSAQAIVSSVSMLLEFLEWSHECRVHAVQKYGVSYDSIWLLSALSRYGEREESKSGMTDCSSVSSVLGSESLNFGNDSARRKRKYAGYLHDLEDSYPCASDPYLSRIPEKTTSFNGSGMRSLSFDNFFEMLRWEIK